LDILAFLFKNFYSLVFTNVINFKFAEQDIMMTFFSNIN